MSIHNHEDEDETKQKGVSVTSTAINLLNTSLGAGILTMPWGLAGSSVITGVMVLAFVLLLNSLTFILIVLAGEEHQVFDLGALIGKIKGRLGRYGSIFVNLMVWFTSYLCLVSYLILVCDSVLPFMPNEGFWSERYVLVIVASLVLLPINFVPMRYLAFTSTLSILMNIYTFGLLCYVFISDTAGDENEQPESICILGFSKGTMAFVSSLMFTVCIQMCVLPLYQSMEDRTPHNFAVAVGISSSLLFVLFGAFSVVGYFAFGSTVSPDVLKNLPDSITGNIARAGMALVVIGVWPLVMLPAVSPIKEWARSKARSANNTYAHASYTELELQPEEEVTLVTLITLFSNNPNNPNNFYRWSTRHYGND